MAIQADKTLKDWSRCATALGQANTLEIMATAAKVARAIGASDDTTADALPHIFKAVWDNGISIGQACGQAVMSKHRTAQTLAADAGALSLDAMPTERERDALEAAIHAAGLGRDDVAKSYGGGSRGSLMSLEQALAEAPADAARVITALVSNALMAKTPERNVQTYASADAPALEAAGAVYWKMPSDALMALHGGKRDRSRRAPAWRALKVSIVADALGVSRPKTKVESKALRHAACHAYGIVQSVRDDSQSATALEALAYAYVTRDRRAYGGNGQAVWQSQARPEGIDYALYRPLSSFQPDIFNGSHVAALQPVRGHRANTGSKGRKGPAAGQASADTSHGASASRTCGTVSSAMPGDNATALMPTVDRGANDAGRAAKRSVRADDAALAAHEVSDARAVGTWCQRPLISPESALCGCGPTTGAALIPHYLERVTSSIGQADALEILKVWTHALSVCPVPKSGALGQTCACGRKRGRLTDAGEHRAR
jgi:hypothetical protein